jgi:hypothetical protein
LKRVKCPRERQGKNGACEREGCNHLSGTRSRICGCCAVQLGQDLLHRLQLMRQYDTDYDLARAEDEALTMLNRLPRRDPVGRGWTTVSPADQRRREWRR